MPVAQSLKAGPMPSVRASAGLGFATAAQAFSRRRVEAAIRPGEHRRWTTGKHVRCHPGKIRGHQLAVIVGVSRVATGELSFVNQSGKQHGDVLRLENAVAVHIATDECLEPLLKVVGAEVSEAVVRIRRCAWIPGIDGF